MRRLEDFVFNIIVKLIKIAGWFVDKLEKK
jgi:hypothetical protein